MAIGWTKEKISELTLQEVTVLHENAKARNNFEIANWCGEILITKKPARKARIPSKTKALEAECSNRLSEFAKHLSGKYDLSAKTATKKSEGIKGFRSHNLTAKDGQAKLGGDQRTGKVAIDRYISYRVKDEIFSLSAWLENNEAVENFKWQVRGPIGYFLSSGSANGDSSTVEEFIEFNEASQRFEELISKLTAKDADASSDF